MNRINLWFAVSLFLLCYSAPAEAAQVFYTTTITTLATDHDSEANEIQVPFNITSSCNVGGNARAYILREDKQMFAAALTASALSKSVTVGIETAAPSITVNGSTTTCAVFVIFYTP